LLAFDFGNRIDVFGFIDPGLLDEVLEKIADVFGVFVFEA
jgi:hypothetical protein